MSSLKIDKNIVKPSNRMNLNTTIDKDVFTEFKASCKASGIPMNTLIESFMRQYSAGEFYLKFGSNRQINVSLDDDNNFAEITKE